MQVGDGSFQINFVHHPARAVTSAAGRPPEDDGARVDARESRGVLVGSGSVQVNVYAEAHSVRWPHLPLAQAAAHVRDRQTDAGYRRRLLDLHRLCPGD